MSFDFVLFANYERQLQTLLDRPIDIAWNGSSETFFANAQLDRFFRLFRSFRLPRPFHVAMLVDVGIQPI